MKSRMFVVVDSTGGQSLWFSESVARKEARKLRKRLPKADIYIGVFDQISEYAYPNVIAYARKRR